MAIKYAIMVDEEDSITYANEDDCDLSEAQLFDLIDAKNILEDMRGYYDDEGDKTTTVRLVAYEIKSLGFAGDDGAVNGQPPTINQEFFKQSNIQV